MKNQSKKLIFSLGFVFLFLLLESVYAQTNAISFESSEQEQNYSNLNHFSVELDPAPFILSGYSVSLKFSSKNLPNLAIMGSIYSADFPDGMMIDSNRDKGWKDVRIETSYAVLVEYFFNTKRDGIYIGPSLFLYNKSVTLESSQKRTTFSSSFPNIRAGYIWYPFNKMNLYLNPWINIGSEITLDNNNTVNGISFDVNKINCVIALHVGYSFDL